MTTVYDVPPTLLIEKVAKFLKDEAKIEPPEWAPFAKTGVHTKNSPVQPDWWFTRSAAVLRKVYILGPMGPSRLSAEFGGRRDDGSAPYHPRKGSRSIIRLCLTQLEQLGLVAKTKQGRVVSPQGRKLLDNVSFEIMKEMAKTNPELTKYLGKTR
jgi:small subunit ribosomal protein S19e